MASNASRQARQAARDAGRAAPDHWIEALGRAGYAAKGVVYIIVGVLAVQAGVGSGGQATGARGALREIASQPFGQILLGLAALGLACYAAWRLVMAVKDPSNEGTDAEGIVKRLGFAGSGIVNGALAVFAARAVVVGMSSGGGGGSQQTALTARVMSQPFGLWLVGLAGVVVLAVGLYHFYRAYEETFMSKYKAGEMSAAERRWARRIGKVGLSARGVTFCIIGVFIVQAALQADPSETRGLEGAFQTLLRQPYGPWLLALVAAGFVCYGIYCFSFVRYRYFHT